MRTQWEYDLVENPFCEQLKTMDWQWLEGDTDVPELTDLLTGRVRVLEGVAVASRAVPAASSLRSASPTGWRQS